MSPRRLIFLLLVFSYLYFYGTRAANANARYDLTVSLAAHGNLWIDRYVGNTPDWSRHGGHYYAAKAPGLSLLAVPPYFLLYRAERLFGLDPLDPDSHLWWANLTVLIALLNVLPAALAAPALVALLSRWGVGPRVAHLAALGWGLATLTFPFATTFFSHTPVAAFLLLALYLVAIQESAPPRWRLPLAGLLCGIATLCEYPAAIPTLGIAAYAWSERRSWRDLAAFCAGGAPALAAMLVYHQICFGSPFATPYAFQNPAFNVASETPMIARLWHLTFGPYRGIFFYSPLLLLWIPGLVLLWRAGLRRQAWLSAIVPPVVLVAVATWNQWEGGYSTGPRHLIPIMPFMMIGAAHAIARFPRVGVLLGSISFLAAFAITVVELSVHEGVRSPMTQLIFPALIRGTWDHDNVGLRLGLSGFWSLVPLLAIWSVLGFGLWQALWKPKT